VSILNANNVFHTLAKAKASRFRDGFILQDQNGHSVTIATSFLDEPKLLSVLETICAALRARGAVATTETKAEVTIPRERPTEGLVFISEPPEFTEAKRLEAAALKAATEEAATPKKAKKAPTKRGTK